MKLKYLPCRACETQCLVPEKIGEYVCDDCYTDAIGEACDTRDEFDEAKAWTWLERSLLALIGLMGLVYIYLCAKGWFR